MPEADDDRGTTAEQPARPPRLPPRWFVRAAWAFHRGYYRVTGGVGDSGRRSLTSGAR